MFTCFYFDLSIVPACVAQCLKDTGIHQFRLLFILAVISGVCFAPLWVIYDLSRILNDSSLVNIFISLHSGLILSYSYAASFLAKVFSFCVNGYLF